MIQEQVLLIAISQTEFEFDGNPLQPGWASGAGVSEICESDDISAISNTLLARGECRAVHGLRAALTADAPR